MKEERFYNLMSALVMRERIVYTKLKPKQSARTSRIGDQAKKAVTARS